MFVCSGLVGIMCTVFIPAEVHKIREKMYYSMLKSIAPFDSCLLTPPSNVYSSQVDNYTVNVSDHSGVHAVAENSSLPHISNCIKLP